MTLSTESKYPNRRTRGSAVLPGRHAAEERLNAQVWPASRAQSSARSNDCHPTNWHIIPLFPCTPTWSAARCSKLCASKRSPRKALQERSAPGGCRGASVGLTPRCVAPGLGPRRHVALDPLVALESPCCPLPRMAARSSAGNSGCRPFLLPHPVRFTNRASERKSGVEVLA